MDQKIRNIMNCLSKEFETDSKQVSENIFELSTKLANHRAFLEFEVSSDILRIEMRYVFGCINNEKNIGVKALTQMLMENVGTFQRSSAYLGLKDVKGTLLTALCSYHIFNEKWEDRDIAHIIGLALFDIMGWFMTWNFPDSILVFSP
jgi:hypothetical protein